MKITSRYTDIPEVSIDPSKIPEKFRHLVPLAREWSISDDVELEESIESSPPEKMKAVVEAFAPHFDALWEWHKQCEHLVPQPDELVMFDIASEAADTVQSMML